MERYKKIKKRGYKRIENPFDKEEEKLDRYLITYSDLITLLLGLFVILYSTSQVDASKFKYFSSALSDYFKIRDSAGKGGDKIFEGQNGVPQPILPRGSEKTIEQIQEEMKAAFSSLIDKGLVSISKSDGELKLRLPEALLFKSGRAEVQPEATELLDSLSKIMQGITQTITIEGHTDSIPIKTFQYESNWQLSSDRAVNILYALVLRGVQEENMSIRAFASQKPVASNSTDEGRSKNRRVEILIYDPKAITPSKEGLIAKDSIIQ